MKKSFSCRGFTYSVISLTCMMMACKAEAQMYYPPGTFSLSGIPVVCGNLPTIVTPRIPDAAMNNGQAILINPTIVGNFPPVLQLWAYAHECGHAFVGPNEIGADCWAITTGKNQGWFGLQDFNYLIQLFWNNPGDLRHPPGPARIAAMEQCYQQN